MPIYKRCSRCGKRIPAMEKCGCYEKKRAKNRPQADNFYNTPEWEAARKLSIAKTYGLDIYSYYKYKLIEYGFTVHHIIPIDIDYDLRLEQSNLIYLTESNHRQIHALYNSRKYDETVSLLSELLKRFKNECSKGQGVSQNVSI